MEIRVFASGSSGNAYYVNDGRTPLLLECGIRFQEIQRRLDFGVSALRGCLISHAHQDHCRAVRELMLLGLDCYMSTETAEALDLNSHHRCHIVSPVESFPLGSWTVTPFATKHDAPGALGFLLSSHRGVRLIYLTDTPYSHYTFKKPTHIMIECNYAQDILAENTASGELAYPHKHRVMQNHMSLETVKEFLRSHDLSLVHGIWLLHLSDANADEARFKREIQELTGKVVIVA